jgi:hypothetical protein
MLRLRVAARRAPKGWRTIVVDDRPYVFTIAPRGGKHHQQLSVVVREVRDGRTPDRVRGTGGRLRAATPYRGREWVCPCTEAEPTKPITPRQIADIIRRARSEGWHGGAGDHLTTGIARTPRPRVP